MAGLPVHQGRDHIAQGRQAEVDFSCLLESIPGGTGLGLPLTSGQINQIELAHPDVGVPLGVQLAALHRDDENGVAARRVLVHVGGADGPILIANRHHMLNFRNGLADKGGEILDVDTGVGPLTELQITTLVLGQKVAHLLLIDFQIRSADQELLVHRLGNVVEDVLERVGDDALEDGIAADAFHREGLAGPGLAVGKDGPVEAVEDRVDEGRKCLGIEIELARVAVVDGVEGERLDGVGGPQLGVLYLDESPVGEHFDAAVVAGLDFLFVQGPTADHNLIQ